MTQFNDYVIGVLRTFAAAAAGAILTVLIAHGVGIDPTVKDALAGVLFASLSAGWYIVVGVLERYVHHGWGWLLLAARKPRF